MNNQEIERIEKQLTILIGNINFMKFESIRQIYDFFSEKRIYYLDSEIGIYNHLEIANYFINYYWKKRLRFHNRIWKCENCNHYFIGFSKRKQSEIFLSEIEYKNHKNLCLECSIIFCNKDNFPIWINDFDVYLTPILRITLEYDNIVVLVNNKEFTQCKYLFFNLSKENLEKYDIIDSIDDMNDVFDTSNELNKTLIDKKTEFIGHVSNLQVWIEYNYDTRILHKNISFPLLNELAKYDKECYDIFKSEIKNRFLDKNLNVRMFILQQLTSYLKITELIEFMIEHFQEIRELQTIFTNETITHSIRKAIRLESNYCSMKIVELVKEINCNYFYNKFYKYPIIKTKTIELSHFETITHSTIELSHFETITHSILSFPIRNKIDIELLISTLDFDGIMDKEIISDLFSIYKTEMELNENE